MSRVAPDGRWLAVVGIGEDGLDGLSASARAVVQAGEVLVGGARHLALLPDHPAERLCWRRPLEATLEDLAARRGRRVVVLASGDPMWFGVGELLARHFGPRSMRVLPAPSTFSLVCARLGWPLSETECLSVHARPLAVLHRHLYPGARLIALSHDGDTPNRVAALLSGRGFGPSRIWTFEHLGGPAERQRDGVAERWQAIELAPLNALAVECIAGADATVWPLLPGLPDDTFQADGMLTKREIRAATIAQLAPLPGQCLWDVGAGSGAIAIEWLRAARRGRALAIEREPARCAMITNNAERLGTPELEVICGAAPGQLTGLPPPDAVFIGGGISTPGVMEASWTALGPGGRLVANVVTAEGERVLLEWQARHGGELTRLAIARLAPVGPHHGWRPLMPVTQLTLTKP
jgi:precorrin-6Y C5,15-methyltransferase (decarboxylating)